MWIFLDLRVHRDPLSYLSSDLPFVFDIVAMGNCFGKPHVSSKKTDAKTVELVERTPLRKVEPGANECHSDPAAVESPNPNRTETSSTDQEGNDTEPGSPSVAPAPVSVAEVTASLDDEEVQSSSPSVASNISEGHADPETVYTKIGPASSLGEAPKLNDTFEEDLEPEPASSTNGTQVYLGYLAKVNDEEEDFGSEFGTSNISEEDVDSDPVTEGRQTKSGESLRRSNSWAVIEQ